jgi:hypothetical protein
MRPPDESDVGHAAGENAQTAEGVVPGGFRDQYTTHGHLGDGPAAHPGFGSYRTAWTWLHKLRAALVRPEREPLGRFVQIDEALVGGRSCPKELVLVAAEAGGRVRLAHAENNDEATLKRFADGQVASDVCAMAIWSGVTSLAISSRIYAAATLNHIRAEILSCIFIYNEPSAEAA